MVSKQRDTASSLSVIVPCYNEERTIGFLLNSVMSQKIVKEVIVVDDHSTDSSLRIIESIKSNKLKLIKNQNNMGKGFAVRKGISLATGSLVIIQDADLEYNPADYQKLARPIISGVADVVYGSRFLASDEKAVLYFWHKIGNVFLTFLSNMVTNLALTDMETCYKVFTKSVASQLTINEDRFGIEPEIPARISKMNVRIYEVGISYHGRTYADGKKIGWRDGFREIYCIVKYNLH
jgi:glycosyltransferase involved in cell wall biosynthesis